MNRTLTRILLFACVNALTACGTLQSVVPASKTAITVPDAWQAPLPPQGGMAELSQWWQKQGDPLLLALIDAAQNASPGVSQALQRIAQARATQAQANAALLPGLSAQAGAARGVSQPGIPVATTVQAGLMASWELDLVGANRAVSEAASAQIQSTQAQWHDARVSVAAELANLYFSVLSCRQMQTLASHDADSQQESARLIGVSAGAGLSSSAQAGLARAAAADSRARLAQQTAQCDVILKGLVSLTALAEDDLRKRLDDSAKDAHALTPPVVARVPADTLAQRPDVFAAEKNVHVAAAAVGNAIAQRLPRLSLNGSIGAMRVSSGGLDQDVSTWSFGPLALSMPIYDAGQREAAQAASQAAYQSAVRSYQATVRQAVREVEESLVQLQSLQAREQDTLLAQQSFNAALAATQARFRQGLASGLELQEARRAAWAADGAVLGLQLQRKLAWVTLYRALGGGFEPIHP
ncbi:MAG: efflux transporter outer membrane subunit [Rhodoferax sp.]